MPKSQRIAVMDPTMLMLSNIVPQVVQNVAVEPPSWTIGLCIIRRYKEVLYAENSKHTLKQLRSEVKSNKAVTGGP